MNKPATTSWQSTRSALDACSEFSADQKRPIEEEFRRSIDNRVRRQQPAKARLFNTFRHRTKPDDRLPKHPQGMACPRTKAIVCAKEKISNNPPAKIAAQSAITPVSNDPAIASSSQGRTVATI